MQATSAHKKTHALASTWLLLCLTPQALQSNPFEQKPKLGPDMIINELKTSFRMQQAALLGTVRDAAHLPQQMSKVSLAFIAPNLGRLLANHLLTKTAMNISNVARRNATRLSLSNQAPRSPGAVSANYPLPRDTEKQSGCRQPSSNAAIVLVHNAPAPILSKISTAVAAEAFLPFLARGLLGCQTISTSTSDF